MPKLVAFCLLLLTAVPAHAKLVFNVTVGSWSVFPTKDNCMAQNRPSSETGREPINTLFIFSKPNGETSLAMVFWPGAITEKDHQISLHVAGQGSFDLPAAPLLDPWTMLRTTDALPDDLLDTFNGRGEVPLYNMLVQPDISDTVTLIDIQDLPRVLTELRHCVDLLGRSD
jgi:hypothetical protein